MDKSDKKYDMIVIGGGVAGFALASSVAGKHKDKSVLIIKEHEKEFVPCGIPYIFGKLKYLPEKNIKNIKPLIDSGSEVFYGKVTRIDRGEKSVFTDDGVKFKYNKLVIATGSAPIEPVFIKGYDSRNVFYIKKDFDYIKKMVEAVTIKKRIVIIGGGFIGVEVADELSHNKEREITLIEMQDNCLSAAFSKDFCNLAEKKLAESGVKTLTKTKVVEIIEDKNELIVILSNEQTIKTDIVIFSLGYKPNTIIAEDSGLKLNKFKAIEVNAFMQTDDADIYAVGDCAKKTDFFSGRDSNVMLASVAGSESRFLADNIFSINSLKNGISSIKIFSTSINGSVFSSAGMTLEETQKLNIPVVVGEFNGFDKHPSSLPDCSEVFVKLLVMEKTGHIVGGEINGGISSGEMINIVGMAIQTKMSIQDFYVLQFGTHPLLTGGPTVIPLIKAAENAIDKMKK